MFKLQLSGINKQISRKQILSDINLQVKPGEFIVILGPSGCGKTTLLRMIAGLEPVSSGEILIDGSLVNQLPPRCRDVAMVFQNYSLYMHKSVRANLEFGLKMRKVPRSETEQQVQRVAALLKIENLLDRKPHQLSGGEKQRVAIGRSLVRNPRLYLFDEPLSNLDAALRMELRTEIKRIHQQLHNTSIYVTHDQVEAMSMADRLVVMNQGRIMQIGEADDVYLNPENLFVAGFLGNPGMNLLDARLVTENDVGFVQVADARIPLESFGFHSVNQMECRDREKLKVGIRPEAMQLDRNGEQCFSMDARIAVLERLGSETQLVMENRSGEFRVRLPGRNTLKQGDSSSVFVRFGDIRLFDAIDQRVISPQVD